MLASFLTISLISALVIAITSLVTYEILRYVWNVLPGLTFAPRTRVLLIVIPIFAAHICSIWTYAVAYCVLEQFSGFGSLSGDILPAAFTYDSFIERLYFSAGTYTSLGYDNVKATHDLRMLVSAEVLNGLVMIGWTVSFTYLTMEKFWSLPHRQAMHKPDNPR